VEYGNALKHLTGKQKKEKTLTSRSLLSKALSHENQQLVTDEPVEFEEQLVEVGDFWRITVHSRGIYRGIYLLK